MASESENAPEQNLWPHAIIDAIKPIVQISSQSPSPRTPSSSTYNIHFDLHYHLPIPVG